VVIAVQLHPAVKEAGILPEGGEEIAVQVAYTPKSQCFGCGESCTLAWFLQLPSTCGSKQAAKQLSKAWATD
jgi:hypothetical protein